MAINQFFSVYAQNNTMIIAKCDNCHQIDILKKDVDSD